MASTSKLAATARVFTPSFNAANHVIDCSFISQTLPDISAMAGVVGLCPIPQERTGADDLGWHIADFLAFKSLLCGDNFPRAQTWLAQCDIASLVEANSEHYVHGRDRRVVSGAAEPLTYSRAGRMVDREDNIRVEPSAGQLRIEFTTAITEKVLVVKKNGWPLVIIVCGLTSLEQDVFFGKTDGESRLTSAEIRQIIGGDVDVIFITPALFSAGWQINPAFCNSESKDVRADQSGFLTRQFGGIFANNIVEKFLGWECPMIDHNQLAPDTKLRERFPGPAMPTEKQQSLINAFKIKIHSCLVGRCSLHHQNHSFSFDKKTDDWESLIRPRTHKSLEDYKKKWDALPVDSTSGDNTALHFLGNAFGGTRSSQINHIKHLILESFEAWPSFWILHFGQKTMREFKKFLDMEAPDALTCHEYFNILEHRATLNVLADMVVRYFGLPVPGNVRCRDWNQYECQENLSPDQQRSLIQSYQEFCAIIPAANIPPGVNPNKYSPIQTRLDIPSFYMNASLGYRFASAPQEIQGAMIKLKEFLEDIEVQQAKLLVENTVLRDMCADWLQAIYIPVRQLGDAPSSDVNWQELASTKIVPGIDDECEYEVVLANISSPWAVLQEENEVRNGNSSGRSLQHTPTIPRMTLMPEASAGTITVVPGYTEHDLKTSSSRNLPDKVNEFHEERDDLFQSSVNTTEEKDRLELIDQLSRLKVQLKQVEQHPSGPRQTHDSDKTGPSMADQAVLGAPRSTNAPILGQKEYKVGSAHREDKFAAKAAPGVYGDRLMESRHSVSPQTVPHGVREATTATQKNEPQVETSHLETRLDSIKQDQESSSSDQHHGTNTTTQDRSTEESSQETTAPEELTFHRTHYVHRHIEW